MAEEKLIKKAQKGNEHAYRVIVETYRNHVFRVVYRVVRNERDAEEIAQDVFVRAYYRLSQYENRGFKTWLTRMAMNYAIDYRRKVAARKEENLHSALQKADEQKTEKIVLQQEKAHIVHERLHEVPKNYRDVLIAFYIEDKSYEEIANEQQLAVKTIETKLYRARSWLRTHWKEEDFW